MVKFRSFLILFMFGTFSFFSLFSFRVISFKCCFCDFTFCFCELLSFSEHFTKFRHSMRNELHDFRYKIVYT